MERREELWNSASTKLRIIYLFLFSAAGALCIAATNENRFVTPHCIIDSCTNYSACPKTAQIEHASCLTRMVIYHCDQSAGELAHKVKSGPTQKGTCAESYEGDFMCCYMYDRNINLMSDNKFPNG